MQENVILSARYGVAALAIMLVSACASVTPEQLSAVEAKATSALSEARSAKGAADNAMKAASAAAEAAASAQAAADAAMACCNENKDRIERMFEQTMKK